MQALVNEGKLAWSLHWNAAPNGIGMTPNDLRWEVLQIFSYALLFSFSHSLSSLLSRSSLCLCLSTLSQFQSWKKVVVMIVTIVIVTTLPYLSVVFQTASFKYELLIESESSRYTLEILQTRYQELLQYGALHGDYNVPYQRANYVKQKKIVTEMSSISSSSAAAFLSSPFSLSLSSPASASSNNKILPSHTLGVGVEYVLPDLRTSHGLSDEISGPSAGMYLGKSPDKSVR